MPESKFRNVGPGIQIPKRMKSMASEEQKGTNVAAGDDYNPALHQVTHESRTNLGEPGWAGTTRYPRTLHENMNNRFYEDDDGGGSGDMMSTLVQGERFDHGEKSVEAKHDAGYEGRSTTGLDGPAKGAPTGGYDGSR